MISSHCLTLKYPVYQWQTVAPQEHLAGSCWKLNGAWQDSEILRVSANKKFDGSTSLLYLDFIFIFRIIDFKSGNKDYDSDGTLFQSDGKSPVCAGWHLYNKCSLYLKSQLEKGD